MDKKKFYITTTLPYVNADPHIGFALEIVQADAIARYQRLRGYDVIFNTGTDEHGLKIYQRAIEENKDPQAYVDEYAAKFEKLKTALNLSYTHFIRTTNPQHKQAAQEFWKRCFGNGDIYKKTYRLKYCVGCELEKTESELKDGHCPLHPNLELEIIEEENYFFRFSKYREALLKLYEERKDFVIPPFRLNEIKKFVESGLQDFSISRLKEKMPWGVPVPNDPEHVMYVWFDALVNYISTLGWPASAKASAGKPSYFEEFWGTNENPIAMQVAGKDNLRQQAAMWQAMLMSAGLANSKQIMIHGFITVEGQKISKSLGNVVDPFELVSKYGTDPVRYYLLREIPTHEDGDFSIVKFEERYNADLANGLGNLISRTMAVIEKDFDNRIPKVDVGKSKKPFKIGTVIFDISADEKIWDSYQEHLDELRLDLALKLIFEGLKEADRLITAAKIWDKKSPLLPEIMYLLLENLRHYAWMLKPFLPETSDKIFEQLFPDERERQKELSKTIEQTQVWGGLTSGTKVKRGPHLFPRLGS